VLEFLFFFFLIAWLFGAKFWDLFKLFLFGSAAYMLICLLWLLFLYLFSSWVFHLIF